MEKLSVSSPCFEDGGLIPIAYTGYGADHSPGLVLDGLCSQAVSIAILMNDIDHPIPHFNHWLIWNIPAMPQIPGSIPHGAKVESLGQAVQGVGYGINRYRGPKPPFHSSHVYQFHAYVLDSFLGLPGTARKRRLLAAMKGHILQHAILSGHYR